VVLAGAGRTEEARDMLGRALEILQRIGPQRAEEVLQVLDRIDHEQATEPSTDSPTGHR